ncbi:MAG TPA: Sir2 family NAD-dependent protein deacetylase [Pseudomonadales bacterium]|nr:Sir2 family NAD-dependent protein deacetylase [Pseudomonadales bacterium]
MTMTHDIQQAAEAIRAADALLITAGAGIGVDSGLPDFRGNEGFWKAYPVVAKLGLCFAEIANPEWFERDPHLAWAFYGHRLNLYRKTVPHDGFATLLQWAVKKPEGYFVFTSNVDGHFQRAGFDPERVVECHGSIHHFQCAGPCHQAIWEAAEAQVSVDENIFRALRPLPQCDHCGGIARPNIMMFGDFTWIADRSNGQYTRLNQWLGGLQKRSARVAVVELGAGTAIPTVRHLSEDVTERLGGTLIRINPREAKVPEHLRERCFSIESGALQGIEKLLSEIQVSNGR